jgi:biuret amidohydrolase
MSDPADASQWQAEDVISRGYKHAARRAHGASQLRMWRSWQRLERAAEVTSPFLPGAAHTQIVPEIRPTDHEAVLDKITMSAFEGTWLDIALRDCGITTVVVVGVAMEIGIEPTVRHAADLG